MPLFAGRNNGPVNLASTGPLFGTINGYITCALPKQHISLLNGGGGGGGGGGVILLSLNGRPQLQCLIYTSQYVWYYFFFCCS